MQTKRHQFWRESVIMMSFITLHNQCNNYRVIKCNEQKVSQSNECRWFQSDFCAVTGLKIPYINHIMQWIQHIIDHTSTHQVMFLLMIPFHYCRQRTCSTHNACVHTSDWYERYIYYTWQRTKNTMPHLIFLINSLVCSIMTKAVL